MAREFVNNSKFTPMIGVVNRRLNILTEDISKTVKSLGFEDMGLIGLKESIERLHYDGSQVTATELRSQLPEAPQKSRFVNSISQLKQDLDLVEIIENNGIEGINDRLNELFRLSQKELPAEEVFRIVSEINHILYSAIRLFPFLTSGIAIHFKSGIENHEIDNEKYKGGNSRGLSNREPLRLLMQLNPQTAIFTLPFQNDIYLDPDPESKRYNLAKSIEVFSLEPQKKGDNTKIAFALNIQALSRHRTQIALDEIEFIEFTEIDTPSPIVRVPFIPLPDSANQTRNTAVGTLKSESPVARPNAFENYCYYVHSIRREDALKELSLNQDDTNPIAFLAQRV